MRILIATPHPNVIGGVEVYLGDLIPQLLGRGHEIAMLYDYRPREAGKPVDPSGGRLRTWFAEEFGDNPQSWRELLDWNADVCYSQRLEDLQTEAAVLEKFPTVAYCHDYRGTCATGQKSHGFPVFRPCERTLGPMCLALHYPRRCGGLNPASAWRAFQSETRRNAQLKKYTTVLVASNSMHREFERHGLSSEKLQLLPLPAAGRQLANPPARASHSGRILYVGRLTDLKGVPYLIRAIALASRDLAPRLSLTIAGVGAERTHVEQLAAKLGVAAKFAGWVDAADRDKLMCESDLLAVPSLWPEPFGMTGVEAGRYGLPAVGYAVGGIPDWLIPGETGELAPGDLPTVEGLAQAIVRALQDGDRYRELCRGALRISARYSTEAHLARLETILAGAAGNAPAQASLVNYSGAN